MRVLSFKRSDLFFGPYGKPNSVRSGMKYDQFTAHVTCDAGALQHERRSTRIVSALRKLNYNTFADLLMVSSVSLVEYFLCDHGVYAYVSKNRGTELIIKCAQTARGEANKTQDDHLWK